MGAEKDIKDQISDLSQQIYDDRKMVEQNRMLYLSDLSEKQKLELEIKDLYARRRIEKNERIRDILYANSEV